MPTYLSSGKNLPSTQGDTYSWNEGWRGFSLSNIGTLIQQLIAMPNQGWVLIQQPLILEGLNVVTEEIPAGVYKINSNWQYVLDIPETDTFSRFSYRARPILDLMVEEQETWWSSQVLDRIRQYFPNWSFHKFGYWKLVGTEIGLRYGGPSALPGAVQGSSPGIKNFPWIIAAAIAAKVLL